MEFKYFLCVIENGYALEDSKASDSSRLLMNKGDVLREK